MKVLTIETSTGSIDSISAGEDVNGSFFFRVARLRTMKFISSAEKKKNDLFLGSSGTLEEFRILVFSLVLIP